MKFYQKTPYKCRRSVGNRLKFQVDIRNAARELMDDEERQELRDKILNFAIKRLDERGGDQMHAPGYLRDGFDALLEGDEDAGGLYFRDDAKQKHWERMNSNERLRFLSGQLWQSTDILPSHICELLDLDEGSTYAKAARKIREHS